MAVDFQLGCTKPVTYLAFHGTIDHAVPFADGGVGASGVCGASGAADEGGTGTAATGAAAAPTNATVSGGTATGTTILQGGYEFSDGQMDDYALGLWVADEAKQAGVNIAEHTLVSALTQDGQVITAPGADRGVMFQDYALMPWQTVQDNIGFGLRYGTPGHAFSIQEREHRIHEFIELVGLKGHEKKSPHQLSGGMRQQPDRKSVV